MIFYADPRPQSERRAVLWLWDKTDSPNITITFKRNEGGDLASYWVWDGANGHDYGYYYIDLVGDLPIDGSLGVKFKAFSVFDKVEYGYSIKSITDTSYHYTVKTELFTSQGQKTDIELPDHGATIYAAGGRYDLFPAGSFPIINLEPGLYYLKFSLDQDGILQDIKYVFFWIASTDVNRFSQVLRTANCRLGPGMMYNIVTAFVPGQEMRLMGLNPNKDWGKFEATIDGNTVQCWMALSMVDTKGDLSVPILEVPPTPVVLTETSAPSFSCSNYKDSSSCNANNACEWVYSTFNPGYCRAK